jgi:hypothetical protein
MTAQVVKEVPDIRDGCISLPAEPNLEHLVDWEAVKRSGA